MGARDASRPLEFIKINVRARRGAEQAVALHHLDADTSGVCLFAKRAEFATGWRRALADARTAIGQHLQVFWDENRRIRITRLRQHYHSNFGSLLQNVAQRRENSPGSHHLTPVTVSERRPKIRLRQTVKLNGRSGRCLRLGIKNFHFIA